jgi:glutamate/tyrosine decarboxylase-like PLP-dependent enzyme
VTFTDNWVLSTKVFEQQNLKFFADLYRLAAWSEAWGYQAQASSESNFQALYFAREHFKGGKTPAVFYSDPCHSSIKKACYYLGLTPFGKVAMNEGYKLPANF